MMARYTETDWLADKGNTERKIAIRVLCILPEGFEETLSKSVYL